MSTSRENPSVPSSEPSSTPLPETPSALSRRGFLGGVTGVAATLAAGGLGLEPLLNPGARASAAEVGPLIGQPRLQEAYDRRIDAANRMINAGIPAHPCNGDEAQFLTRFGSYTKGLPHIQSVYEVDGNAYNAMINALTSGVPSDFELIPLGGARKLVNPQAGLAFDTEGFDPHQFVLPPAPKFISNEIGSEATELYWMALLRDTGFDDYTVSPLVTAACQELTSLVGFYDFKGPTINGQVTPQTLFRDDLPGALTGPYISQFLLRPVPFGAEYIVRRIRVPATGSDKMRTLANWFAVQNGNVPETEQFDGTRRFIRNGRDLGQWVHIDVLFQAYFDACLILGTPPDPTDTVTGGGIGCPVNPGNPYRTSLTQEGFGTWGPPAIKTLLCEVATRALKAVWFQKWFVHRRLRPEAWGGRLHLNNTGMRGYPILRTTGDAYNRMFQKYGTWLLPQVFPEGSPTHPAYGAGHATVAGACVTVLKALFDGSFTIPNPVVVTSNGTALTSYSGGTLTVTGELNKLASNVATGRNHAGVHWRSDGAESLKLGEAVAIEVLRDHLATFNEGGSFTFQKFDGTTITIS